MSFAPSRALAQTVAQCQENEALLEIQISYQLINASDYLDISIQGPRLAVDSNQSSLESFSFFQWLMASDHDVSLCVPEDQCLLVIVKDFSSSPFYYEDYQYQLLPDDVSIVYNGQLWSEKKGPFAYSMFGTMIVAELGPCEVVCEPEDALVEIEAVTGYTPDYDWQILDDATGQIIQHCPSPFQNSSICYWESEQYYHERLCLPREGCYTLLVAERSSDSLDFDAKSLHVSYDGNHIESFEYLQFINVALSDGSTICDTTYCDSDSTLVELYFFRQDMEVNGNRNLTWSLSAIDGSLQVGDLGMGIITSSDRPLYYHKECIPKVDSCVELSTSMTEDYASADSLPLSFNATYLDEGAYQENVTYRFVVDGIIYSDYYIEFGYSDEFVNGTFKVVHNAGDCSSSQICGDTIDAYYVLQVDILTEPTWQTAEVSFHLMSRSAAGESSLGFTLAPFYPDQKYRFYSCVHESWFLSNNPDPVYCTEFAVSDYQFFDGQGSYNISIDGIPLTGTQTTGSWMYYNNYGPLTHITGQCQVGSSSEGARVGLIVGCVVAALFAIIGGLAYCNHQTQSAPPTQSDPPSPSLPIAETTAIAMPIVEEQYPFEPEKDSPLTPHHIEDTPTTSSNDNAFQESEHEAQA